MVNARHEKIDLRMGIPPCSLITVVAFDAASPAAPALEFILDGTPIAGMGIHLQARACAVAFDADVALAVACLTGAQISSCLGGMIPRPSVTRE